MESSTLFNILITILLTKFVLDTVLKHLNAKHFNDETPNEVSDVYEINEYQKSQQYKKKKVTIPLTGCRPKSFLR